MHKHAVEICSGVSCTRRRRGVARAGFTDDPQVGRVCATGSNFSVRKILIANVAEFV
jgi:hypothetical protein